MRCPGGGAAGPAWQRSPGCGLSLVFAWWDPFPVHKQRCHPGQRPRSYWSSLLLAKPWAGSQPCLSVPGGAFCKHLRSVTWGWLLAPSQIGRPRGQAASTDVLLLEEGVSSLPPSLAEPGARASLANRPAQPGTPGPFGRPRALGCAHPMSVPFRTGKEKKSTTTQIQARPELGVGTRLRRL